MSVAPSAADQTSAPGMAGAIDVDVHAALPVQLNAVLAYMPRAWREKLAYVGTAPLSGSPLDYTYLAGKYVVDPDVPLGGERTPQAVISAVCDEVFEARGAAIGQLFAIDAVTHAMQAGNPDLAAMIAGAFNAFMLDQWLADARVRYALVVSPLEPALAVAEIHRHGSDPRVSSVWVPSTATKLWQLEPVLEAAVERGLAIVCHPGSGRLAMTPARYADEGRFNAPMTAWSELSGLIAHQTFARLPDLRVALLECGFAWLPALLARMGDPADLVREHVRIAAAGDGDRSPREWAEVIEWPGSVLPEVLVYTGRAPAGVFDALSGPVRHRVLAENAKAVVRI